MALNGSGSFARLYNWVTDKGNGVKITASRMDAEFDGMATALSTALYKDGQQTNAANQNWGGFRLTSLGDASADTDGLNRQTGDGRYLKTYTETTVASAATCDVLGAAGDRVSVTGTTTITSLGSTANEVKLVRFTGALTLTHNATTLILPEGANITTAANDSCIVVSDGSGNARVLAYFKATNASGALENIVEDTTPQLGGQLDVNGQVIGDGTNELLEFVEDASAVNNWEIENEATGGGPILRAKGDDANVDANFQAKGTGVYNFKSTADQQTIVRLFEDTDNGSNYIGLKPPAAVTGSIDFVLPDGDGTAGQYLKTDASGNLDFDGPAINQGKHTIWIPAGAMTPRTTNGAASGTTELATNDVMLSTLDFDQTTEEGAGFMIGMPKSWDESTVTFIPIWTAASGSGGVVWSVQGVATSNDDALDAALGTGQTSTDTLLLANDNHTGPESSAITIAGTPAEGDLVYFEITREVADGSDTLTADAKLIGIKLLITYDAATDA